MIDRRRIIYRLASRLQRKLEDLTDRIEWEWEEERVRPEPTWPVYETFSSVLPDGRQMMGWERKDLKFAPGDALSFTFEANIP